ncbi:hypothetical protein ASPBRDRAFT_44862 [Aspergillus brasiliensis CBS 101740]|uniref:Chalcone isomerase domain-containing protein n=1 Tax=Aspergillus brasiliensis (strain CBS 101740 / IMI 381727 / IBT 21946) TaxID=767769 RepID=A0A1L9UG41_ASPBC|nr:hypothetical protein ASPBRDRAFT_44862 [Aspergillus brasiliensis CBS 101740]
MPPIPPLPLRAARAQWRTCAQHFHASTNTPKTRLYSTTRTLRSSTTTTASSSSNPLRSARPTRSREQDLARTKRSMYISASGMVVCAIGMYGVIKSDVFGLEQTATTTDGVDIENSTSTSNSTKLDGPATGFPTKPTLTHIKTADGTTDQVETGTSSIPHFPAVIHLPKWLESETPPVASGTDLPSQSGSGEEGGEEYHLLGLGIRTVSFLNFQVYVVGLYVAASDLAELQSRLVRTAVHPPGKGTESVIDNEVGATAATSLVSTEQEKLRELLLDAEKGEQAWDMLLRKDGLRTAFRVVPTRNTDFLHLRDGWVRGITGRAQKYNNKEGGGEFEGEEFGQAMGEFKGLFGGGQRKSVPKGQVLVLARGAKGQLDVLVQGGGGGKEGGVLPDRYLGRVKDERISRLVWLNYLAGKNVSSEGARRSVVDGIMGVVERPVGTV